MANKFKTMLSSILSVIQVTTLTEDEKGSISRQYVWRYDGADKSRIVFEPSGNAIWSHLTYEEEVLNEDCSENDPWKYMDRDKLQQWIDDNTIVVADQEVVYDEEDATWVVDVTGRRLNFEFHVIFRVGVYDVGIRGPKDGPLEIIEGYPECQGKVPRSQ